MQLQVEMVLASSATAAGVASLVRTALESRKAFVEECHSEGTDAYRLFHGAVEGLPGVTLDRYGDLLLWQTFRDDQKAVSNVEDELLPMLHDLVSEELGITSLQAHWTDRRRGARTARPAGAGTAILAPDHKALELGLRYHIEVPASGRDPLLYLDFRAARRWLSSNCQGREVLNAFAFTCGAGVAALAGGAASVTNLDFSEAALATGRLNAAANNLEAERFETLCADALPTLRMFAGLPVTQDRRRPGRGGRARGRGGRGSAPRRAAAPPKVRARQFDVCVLDPPTWATSSFGAVDLVRDYQSLFKPCVLATRSGGTVLACNHVSTVEMEEWLDTLDRCARKAGRPIGDMEVLVPEADFPTSDGRHPLKMVLATLE